MKSMQFQRALKALLLIGMGLFLYGRIANGTLYYYINQRFAIFTLFAVLGLLVVGLNYHFRRTTPGQSEDGTHDHSLSWAGALIVALPILLGLLVPPQPLGVAALENREMNLEASGSALPSAVRAAAEKSTDTRNMLDWWHTFQSTTDYHSLAGEQARVVGFVYHDERYGPEHFVLTRYVVSCCVADAAVVGMVVQTQDAHNFKEDQWVEVEGTLAVSDLENWKPPVLVAQSTKVVDIPNQPYLYP